MDITPFPTKIFIKLDTMKAGALDLTDQNVLSEGGEIVAIGNLVSPWWKVWNLFRLKVGDRVRVKAWGLDSVDINGEVYYVADKDTKALLCVTK